MLAAGVLLGVAAKVADESAMTWASALGDHPGTWVLIVAVIGRRSGTASRAARRAGAFSVAMCVGYYAWSIAVLGFGRGPFILAWLVLASAAVPAAAAAAWWAARTSGLLPGVVMGFLAGLVLSGGSLRGAWLSAAGHLPAFAVRPVQATLELLMVTCIVAGLPRHAATRLWAAAALVPAWWMPDLVNRFVGLFA